MKRALIIALLALIALVPHASLLAQEPSGRIVIAPENRCSNYDRADYSYPQSVEAQIIARLGDRLYSPYSGETFASAGEANINHIVALSEAHDSGLCPSPANRRRAFARDLNNLTLASPEINWNAKGDRDLAEWMPAHNRCWFATTVVRVKRRWGLTMDAREAAAALDTLSNCGEVGGYLDQAGVYAEQNEFESALVAYDIAIRLDPANATAWMWRGIVLMHMKRQEEAVVHFTRAIQLRPDEAFSYFGRGVAYYRLAYYDRAVDDLDTAEALARDNPDLLAQINSMRLSISAMSGPRPFTVARDEIQVHAGPGTEYAVIGIITRGDRYEFDGRNAAGDWVRFAYVEGVTGWVYAELLTIRGEIERAPVVEAGVGD